MEDCVAAGGFCSRIGGGACCWASVPVLVNVAATTNLNAETATLTLVMHLIVASGLPESLKTLILAANN